MDFFDEINNLKYLYLISIVEPVDNELLITIKEATVSSEQEDLFVGNKNLGPVRSISSDGPRAEYEIFFESYGSYSITNESFTALNEKDERVGRLLCIYSKSTFLDYIRETTLVNYVYDYNDTLGHYALNCQNHIVDIVSIDKPVIRRIS